MSTANVHLNLPVQGNGSIDIKIDVANLEMLTERDRAFVLGVIDHLSSFVEVASPGTAGGAPAKAPVPALMARPEVPEVLRGRVGSRS